MAFFEFPHTRTYDSDLGWLINAFNEISEKLDTYLENAVIKFADPITWDITEQYTALTCVIDSDGTAYLSKQPVPAGVDISNTDYWLPIFNYDDNINILRSQIAYNAQVSPTTGQALTAGDLVFWNGLIYKVLVDMPAGTAFIDGTNITPYTVDEKINEFGSDISDLSDDIDDIQNDITTINGDIIAVNNRVDHVLPDLWVFAEDYGAVGDGVTDDTVAIQKMFDECPDGATCIFGKRYYLTTQPLYVRNYPVHISGGFGRLEFTPVIKTTLLSGTMLTVTVSGMSMSNIMFEGRDFVQDEVDKLTLVYFDGNGVSGNIDATLINCSFYKGNVGLRCAGRNVNITNSIFSTEEFAVVLDQTVIATDNRGHCIDGNRFHACYMSVKNNINQATGHKNINIRNNFSDYGIRFYEGFGGGVNITGNRFYTQNSGRQQPIVNVKQDASGIETLIQNNDLRADIYSTYNMILLQGANAVVQSNHLDGASGNGIATDGTAPCKVIIIGNTIKNCATNAGTYAIATAAGTTGAVKYNVIYECVRGIAGALSGDDNTIL